MKKYESQRGAILVESALVVGAIFLMLFGTVFLAIIGFDQMSSDGAAYEVAHQASIGASAPPAQAAHNVYPNIAQGNITTAVQPAPAASIAVDYGYNDPTLSVQQNSSNNRHGGVSMMQGTEVVGTANKSSASLLGMPIGVVGSMIEPMWLENGVHFDAENSNAYGGTTPVCAPTPTPTGSATPPPPKCFQGNVFQVGENSPPYYVGFNYMDHCTMILPWDNAQLGQGASAGPTCDNANGTNQQFVPLGVAEFLDFSNWCDPSNPAPNCSVAPANPGLAGSAPSDSTFATIACHQRVYATVATFFQNNTNLQQIYTNQGGFSNLSTTAGPEFYYYFRATGSNAAYPASNSFKDFEGYDTPYASEDVHGGSGIGTTDAAIRKIYNFDGHDVSGPSGSSDPIYPGVGC